MTKPSLPQGTRDFGPDVVRKRNYILNTIRNIFELYGFQPLETPAMENLETLMGKYGEEGDKLIFKILNNGLDNPAKEKQVREGIEKLLQGKNVTAITERALKYDLTIPFARWVAMNHARLSFPFKRYQIQPVWRADRPQKGRYREFYQCDADTVGSDSLLNETELALIYHEVFTQLGIRGYELKINHRKILGALAAVCGGAGKMMDITIVIDKLDKIGLDKVKEELVKRGLDNDQVLLIEKYLGITGSDDEKLAAVKTLFGNNKQAGEGIADIENILAAFLNANGPLAASASLSIDFTLARGLDYYTGIIFEAKAPASINMGSLGGGGRYDDLTGLFGVPGIPGVGISFGVDRIYDVMEEGDLFPPDVNIGSQVLFFNLGENESKAAFIHLQQLRKKGVRGELYPEVVKFEKQFKYAEKKSIPFVVILGEKELKENSCTIKNLASGEQKTIPIAELMNFNF